VHELFKRGARVGEGVRFVLDAADCDFHWPLQSTVTGDGVTDSLHREAASFDRLHSLSRLRVLPISLSAKARWFDEHT
jgi:hypothetical protein